MVPLGKVLTYRKEFVTIDDLATYKRCRVQLHAQGIVLRDSVAGAEIKTKKQQVCNSGEFLVAEIDAKVGGFGIVPEGLDGAIVSSHYFLFVANEKVLDRCFLDFFTRTPAFQDQVTAQGSTNYAAIRPQHVLAYRIPLPPLPEQRRIVARIEELAARATEATHLKETTAYETTNFWKVLSRIARSTDNPLRSLGEMVEFLDGQRVPLSKAERGARKGPYPYYGASGIIDSIDGYLFDEPLLLLSEDGANLINRSTPIAFIAEGKYWVNNHAHVLKPLPAIADTTFLKYALSDYDVSVFNFASAQAKLNQKNAAKIAFPLPSLSEQHRIVSYLDDLQAKVDGLKQLQAKTAAELDALLPSILNKAFAGEL
jgi:type I restriction enzyme S subunit